ncbi:hypothetical protein HN587_02440 [Candidatus Woesearchaeota archaeon]|jgi:hypothetical protein|nr:hypothetical protein [Candidatus Woesearchaeota archaeon]
MAKVVVFEDGSLDVCDRYSQLVPKHEVHIYMLASFFEGAKFGMVEKGGFDPEQIYPKIPDEIMPADVYFLDGLAGKCLEIFPRLPHDRSFLVSSNPAIQEEVKNAGYQLATQYDVCNIADRLSR